MTETLSDVRDDAVEAIEKTRLEGIDPERVLWSNTSPPNWSDKQHTIMTANRRLMRYVRHVRAHSEEVGDRWTEDVAGGHKFEDGSTLQVSLDTMDKWARSKYQDEFNRYSPVKELHLSPEYLYELLQQADQLARTNGILDDKRHSKTDS